MKKLLILFNEKQKVPFADYLKKELKNCLVNIGYFDQIKIQIATNQIQAFWNGKSLNEFDLIYFRRPSVKYANMAKALALYCNNSKIDYLNRSWGGNLTSDKLGDMVRLAYAGLPVPPSVICIPENLPPKPKFSLVVKTFDDHGGYGVRLIKNLAQLQELPNQLFVFQEFYPNDGDYRILVLGDKVGVVEKRIRDKDEFRNSVRLGGREVFLKVSDFSSKMKEIAIKAAQALNLQIAGIDILVDSATGKEWLLEVNPKPTFTPDVTISPELPEITKYFAEKLGIKNG